MRRWLIRILILAVIVGGFFVLDATVFAPKPVEVQVAKVGRGRVESTVANSKVGTVRARRRAKLAPEIGGRIVEITRREGEPVKDGEIIIRLNDRSLQAQLLLSKRQLDTAEAQLEESRIAADQARRDLERGVSLAEKKVISDAVLERYRTTFESAQATVKAMMTRVAQARASVRVTEAELEKTRLRAPFDGIVAELMAEKGEWISPSPPMIQVPGIVDVLDPTSLYISAPMDEVDSARIRVRQRAKVTLDPHPEREFKGTVVRVAPYVEEQQTQNRTVEVEVELEDEEFQASLLPGTSADVEIILEIREDVLRIPTLALIENRRVLVVEKGVLTEREVEVGLKNWEYAEIVSGLSEGEAVVTSLGKAEVQAGKQARVTGTSNH